jgi:lipoprotein-anchoring transpeptidase ErfK/SrfK
MRLFDLLKPSFLIVPVVLLLSSPAFAEPAAKPVGAQSAGQTEAGDKSAPAEEAEADAEDKSSAADPSAAPEENSPDAKANAEAAGPAASKILINIDKAQQHMTVFVDGIEKYSWPVSTGKRGYSTPSGTYTPSSMNKIWYSKEWDNAPMPHAIFYMKDGHAIHGSYETKNLGKPASHGCVRLDPKNATALFELVKATGLENTTVVLDGVTPGGEAKIAKQPSYPRYGEVERGGGWFGPGPGYYPPQPQRRERRGLFGRRWFDPYGGQQGYYRPPPPRGYYRGY